MALAHPVDLWWFLKPENLGRDGGEMKFGCVPIDLVVELYVAHGLDQSANETASPESECAKNRVSHSRKERDTRAKMFRVRV